MPPSFDAANARHRLLNARTDDALPDLVLMLLQGISDDLAAGEADTSSHPRGPNTRSATLAGTEVCPAQRELPGHRPTPIGGADMDDHTCVVKTPLNRAVL